MRQPTLKRAVRITGIGLHTGKESEITISPADADSGIVFNFKNKEVIKARVELVTSTNRGTILGSNGHSIYTVEHILSTLNGMEIDNAEILVEGQEIPSCDGSAKVFVEKIEEAGIEYLDRERKTIDLPEPIWILNGEKGIIAIPNSTLSIYYTVEFPYIGKQWFLYKHSSTAYKNEIAPARTFGFEEEIEVLLASGLAKGGSSDNSIVIGSNGYSVPLRYHNELVRHKLLDLIGDLYLLGARINATVIAVKGGHNLHIELVKRIKEVVNGKERII